MFVTSHPFTNGGEVYFSVQNLTTGKVYPQIHSVNLGASNLSDDGADFFEENNNALGWNFPGLTDANGGITNWSSMYVDNGVAAGTMPSRQNEMKSSDMMDSTLGNTTTQSDHWHACS